MLSTAIIVFREAFEIALILGVVMAATRGLALRGRYVAGGFLAGAAGAMLIALFIDSISNAFEGMGQEMMNAIILFTAAFFIGWTVVWMHSHAREVTAKLKETGLAVKENRLPYYTLSLVIGLAVLREGAEIALFTYSMLATGTAVLDVVTGGLLGAAAGTLLGGLLYFGLIKIPTRHLFTVTGALLTLLVCGLTAVGAGFLVAAGYFSDFSDTLWDSSAFLSQDSWLGQTLHVLIGYIAQPMQIQVIAYGTTLLVLVALMRGLPRYKQPMLKTA